MTKISFLGLGAMGSRMAARLISAGHAVTVWNRSQDRTAPLAKAGARVAHSPRQAATGADFVFAMVRDDSASQSVWLDDGSGALAGLSPEAIGIDCSTLSLAHVRNLAEAFHRAGRAFLDAPLAGSRPQAEAGQLIFLAGGPAAVLAKVSPLLEIMGGAIHHAGDNGAGATVKLMVNALFGAQLAAFAELIGLAGKAGIDVEKAVDIIGATPVCSPAAKASASAMLSGVFAPAFPIDLVAKDFELITRSAEDLAAQVPVSVVTGNVYATGVAQGYGGDNITGIVQLFDGTK